MDSEHDDFETINNFKYIFYNIIYDFGINFIYFIHKYIIYLYFISVTKQLVPYKRFGGCTAG